MHAEYTGSRRTGASAQSPVASSHFLPSQSASDAHIGMHSVCVVVSPSSAQAESDRCRHLAPAPIEQKRRHQAFPGMEGVPKLMQNALSAPQTSIGGLFTTCVSAVQSSEQ
jgi:hypothetical protein